MLVNPFKILREAVRHSPILGLAWAVLGASAVVAIVAGYGLDLRVALLGTIVVIGLMAAMSALTVMVSSLKKAEGETARNFRSVTLAASLLIWGFSLLVVATGTLLIASYFFEWPRALFVEDGGAVRVAGLDKAMWTSVDGREYDSALTYANELLEIDSKNPSAFNAKGAVAFYRGAFTEAATNFEQALKLNPGQDILLSNLADAYVELGRYDDAVNRYKEMSLRGSDWQYEVARAYVYGRKYSEGLALLRAISTNEYRGRARVLEAAALLGLASTSASEEEKRSLVDQAKNKLREGVARDREYWHDKLILGQPEIHESYGVTQELTSAILGEAFSNCQGEAS